MISINQSDAFKKYCVSQTHTQRTFYKKCGATDEILKIIDLNNKRFGSFAEDYIRENFELGPRTSVENDATVLGRKIEIKSARRNGKNGRYFYQHIQLDYDYDFLLTTLLEPSGEFVCNIFKKEDILPHLKKQGKNANQGYTLDQNIVGTYGHKIHTYKDLQQFILK
jgi:hypothetical protein